MATQTPLLRFLNVSREGAVAVGALAVHQRRVDHPSQRRGARAVIQRRKRRAWLAQAGRGCQRRQWRR